MKRLGGRVNALDPSLTTRTKEPFDMAADNLRRQAWLEQKYRAHNRRIEFLLTYEQWRDWWLIELAKRGPGAKRGRSRGCWLMCRIGDQGPYTLGNIYCGTHKDNAADWEHIGSPLAVAGLRAYFAEHGCWLTGQTGEKHPRSKAIDTPDGRFASRAAAAAYYGISTTQLRRRMAKWVTE